VTGETPELRACSIVREIAARRDRFSLGSFTAALL